MLQVVKISIQTTGVSVHHHQGEMVSSTPRTLPCNHVRRLENLVVAADILLTAWWRLVWLTPKALNPYRRATSFGIQCASNSKKWKTITPANCYYYFRCFWSGLTSFHHLFPAINVPYDNNFTVPSPPLSLWIRSTRMSPGLEMKCNCARDLVMFVCSKEPAKLDIVFSVT